MPTESAHADLAVHNVGLVCHLRSQAEYHDWVAVACFYAALHVVEALFARQRPPAHGQSHERRELMLKREHRYSHIYKHYRPLQGIATVARYLEDPGTGADRGPRALAPLQTFSDYMSRDDVLTTAVGHHLLSILKSARDLLGVTATAQKFAEVIPGLQHPSVP